MNQKLKYNLLQFFITKLFSFFDLYKSKSRYRKPLRSYSFQSDFVSPTELPSGRPELQGSLVVYQSNGVVTLLSLVLASLTSWSEFENPGLIRAYQHFPFFLSKTMAESVVPRPWFLDLVPLLVVLLIAAHVLALVFSFPLFHCQLDLAKLACRSLILSLFMCQAYWIYRLATDKQPQRRKAH